MNNEATPVYAENSLSEGKPILEFELDQKREASVKCKAKANNEVKSAYVENSLRIWVWN